MNKNLKLQFVNLPTIQKVSAINFRLHIFPSKKKLVDHVFHRPWMEKKKVVDAIKCLPLFDKKERKLLKYGNKFHY